jgi:hypothetical protein
MRKLLTLLLVSSTVSVGWASSGPAALHRPIPNGSGVPILWHDPGPIAQLDLYWGPGDSFRTPKGPFTFLSEESNGSNPKISVRDAQGVIWDVKFDEEVHSEVAANRIVWALGYLVEEQYFVRQGTITGVKRLGRAAAFVGQTGAFRDARFRRENPATPRTNEEWSLSENPFVGSKEMSGLHILMTMINNWDIDGARNNTVVRAVRPDGQVERQLLVADLGATFGKMGGIMSGHSKWTLNDFRKERFLDGVSGGMLSLAYDGRDHAISRVPLEHARWFATLASQLSEAQIRQAFEAAGATPQEVNGYTAKLVEKIAALRAAAGI